MTNEEIKTCPTHHELAAEFRAFKEFTRILFEEREKLGKERATRMDDRITALEKTIEASFKSVREQTQSAFTASQTAIDKSDKSKHEHDIAANGLAETMRVQVQTYYTKTEADKEFRHIAGRLEDNRKEYENYKLALAGEITQLRKSRDTGEGRSAGSAATWAVVITVIGMLGGGGLVALIMKLIKP